MNYKENLKKEIAEHSENELMPYMSKLTKEEFEHFIFVKIHWDKLAKLKGYEQAEKEYEKILSDGIVSGRNHLRHQFADWLEELECSLSLGINASDYKAIKDKIKELRENHRQFGNASALKVGSTPTLPHRQKEQDDSLLFTNKTDLNLNPSDNNRETGSLLNKENFQELSPDLCLNCGHRREEHFESRNFELGKYSGCHGKDGICRCKKFKPRESKDKKAVNDS